MTSLEGATAGPGAPSASKVLVALGGNAILRYTGEGTAEEQLANVRRTAGQLARLLAAGHRLAVTHGNGPQVGDILLKNELASGVLPPMPLDVCGAESQGMIGYMMQQSLDNELRRARLGGGAVTVLTQTVVDEDDPAFGTPTKPIGPFYSAAEASELRRTKGWAMVGEGGKGFRRVVPSPDPVSIVEGEVVRRLFDEGALVVAVGGGGIPVVEDGSSGEYRGVEAVIDKDLAAALLATVLGVDLLLILTDVEAVFLDYGERGQRAIAEMTPEEGREHLRRGTFPAGSMAPKVEAAVRFVESGGGASVITSLDRALDALDGRAGTRVARRGGGRARRLQAAPGRRGRRPRPGARQPRRQRPNGRPPRPESAPSVTRAPKAK